MELSAEREGVGEGGYETALKQLQLLDEHYENGTRVLYHQHEERLRLERKEGRERGEGRGD